MVARTKWRGRAPDALAESPELDGAVVHHARKLIRCRAVPAHNICPGSVCNDNRR